MGSMTSETATRAAKGCRICGKPMVERYVPFCSAQCKDVDLGRWLNGTYRIPPGPIDEADEAKTRKIRLEDEDDDA